MAFKIVLAVCITLLLMHLWVQLLVSFNIEREAYRVRGECHEELVSQGYDWEAIREKCESL